MRIIHRVTNIAIAVSLSPCLFSVLRVAFTDAFSSQGYGLAPSLSSLAFQRNSNHRGRWLPHEMRSSSVLFLREPSTQQETETESETTPPQATNLEENEAETETENESSTVVKDTVRNIGSTTRRVLMYGSGFVFNCIGIYFGFGILLNLFGYAYSFSLDEGYKIDTIQNKRIEIQFEREAKRYENESSQKLSQLQSRLAVEAVAKAEGTTATKIATNTVEATTTTTTTAAVE